MSDPADDLDRQPTDTSGRLSVSVPVIDVGELSTGVEPVSAVQEIAAACRDWGFFQVTNHGVPRSLVDDAVGRMREFFGLPSRCKEAVLRTRENPWGYYHNELTKNQRDKKEVFDFTSDGVDPVYNASNRWPDMDESFRDTMRRYRDACAGMSLVLLRAMCTGLGVSPNRLDACFDPYHTGFIRLNYYPVRDPLAHRDDIEHLPVADLGVHHHTDAGALTVLLQDDVGGLQVYRDGFWHDVPPVDGAFVINTGDMMQVWSNDRYKAAIHRVLAMEHADRYSIPFFYNPAAGTRVEPLASPGSAHTPHYRSIDWGEFRRKRTDGDYADYGAEVQIAQYRI